MKASLIWPVQAELGEGPTWLEETATLWFVDIKRGRLHSFHPLSSKRETFEVGGQPSFIVHIDEGAHLVGSGRSIRRFADGALGDCVARIDMPAHNRTNDATVDHKGRLWFGTMDDDATRATGAIYRLDGETALSTGVEAVITNGPAISVDCRTLYHVDTLERAIWRFEVANDGSLNHGERFIEIAPRDGVPDGVTLDSEGCLWVALWGGSQVRRYSARGTLLAQVAIPATQVTKIAFGGDRFTTAYVTTARVGLSDAELEQQPLAGGLFAFEAPAPGLPLPKVRFAL